MSKIDRILNNKSIRDILTEGDVQSHPVWSTHKILRKSESVKDKNYLLKLIKTFMNVGFDDTLSSSEFKKGFDSIMEFVKLNKNLKKIVDNNDLEIEFDVLNQMNKDGAF